MPELYRKQTTRWVLGGRRVPPQAPEATREVVRSCKGYAVLGGKPTPLTTDKARSQQLPHKPLDDAEPARAGGRLALPAFGKNPGVVRITAGKDAARYFIERGFPE